MLEISSAEKIKKYKRVMLKISGEALMGDQGYGLHPPTVERIAAEIKKVHGLGTEICMVIGGGNILEVFRLSMRALIGHKVITWACLLQL